MKLDFATLAFGYSLSVGGGTPNWATSLGQGKEYKIINSEEINEILKGMIYSSVPLSKIESKIGKGGRLVSAHLPESPIVLAALFSKVYINETLIENGKFILLITRDTSKSHIGRLRIKYGPSNTYKINESESYSNENFFQTMKSQLKLANNACFFISDINIVNQNELILKTFFVNKMGSVEYSNSHELHSMWEKIADFKLFLPLDDVDVYEKQTLEKNKDNYPLNYILYGAPGTGKSYSLNQKAKETFNREVVLEDKSSKIISTIERITFYDGYTYGQFVGMYKPVTLDNRDISYEYIPGPFMSQLVLAYKNPEDKFCLLIEEINRAKADKVFGNIFQLLDRNNRGESEYPISLSKEQRKYLEENLREESEEGKKVLEKIKNEGLYLPNNLYIWATMNSADDNVQPLDTAFKRRWKFNYISLNANEDKFGNGETFIIGTYKDNNILWSKFRHNLNNTLKINITEDRLIAPFFISPNDFMEIDTDSNIKIIDKNIFTEKVLMYVFDDLLRHYPKLKEKIFNDNIKTFSDIYEKITKNENFLELIFNEVFLSQMLDSEVTDGEELS